MNKLCLFILLTCACQGQADHYLGNSNIALERQVSHEEEGKFVISIEVSKTEKESYYFLKEIENEKLDILQFFLKEIDPIIGREALHMKLELIGDCANKQVEDLLADHFFGFYCPLTPPKDNFYASLNTSSSIPNKNSRSLDDLPMTDEDKSNIRYIVNTLGEKNLFKIALKKEKLERLGRKVRYIHPMKFLAFVLQDKKMRENLKKIKKNPFKWYKFKEGFGEKMKEERKNHTLYPYVLDFSERLNVDSSKVKQYLDDKDWEGLLKFLL
ncbi:MAG: hypothetical protein ACOVOR_05180 [Rhabdochlamydiaceae bacterium]